MTARISILGGPNLDRLGVREPRIYGTTSWEELEVLCREWAADLGFAIDFRQTNGEGDLVGMIHAARETSSGLILNAAAYTHTSVAVRDAVLTLDIPVIELHLTNPAAREEFRRRNFLADIVTATIAGFGPRGYRLALEGMAALLERKAGS
ncbi:MAG: type II 3-dehydroquinate dehydratase [Candidatus Krumholzibacteriia bacterium]